MTIHDILLNCGITESSHQSINPLYCDNNKAMNIYKEPLIPGNKTLFFIEMKNLL